MLWTCGSGGLLQTHVYVHAPAAAVTSPFLKSLRHSCQHRYSDLPVCPMYMCRGCQHKGCCRWLHPPVPWSGSWPPQGLSPSGLQERSYLQHCLCWVPPHLHCNLCFDWTGWRSSKSEIECNIYSWFYFAKIPKILSFVQKDFLTVIIHKRHCFFSFVIIYVIVAFFPASLYLGMCMVSPNPLQKVLAALDPYLFPWVRLNALATKVFVSCCYWSFTFTQFNLYGSYFEGKSNVCISLQ